MGAHPRTKQGSVCTFEGILIIMDPRSFILGLIAGIVCSSLIVCVIWRDMFLFSDFTSIVHHPLLYNDFRRWRSALPNEKNSAWSSNETIEVPGPELVEKILGKTIEVPGQERVVEVPGHEPRLCRGVLIFVLKQTAPNFPVNMQKLAHFWGLGDMFRGMVRSYQLAAKYGYGFAIDLRYHPVSHLVLHQIHGFEQSVDSCVGDLKFTSPQDLENNIKDGTRFPHVKCVLSNGLVEGPVVDQGAIALLYNTFSIPFLTKALNVSSYETVVHFRLGDTGLVSKSRDASATSQAISKLHRLPRDAMVLADSEDFKNEAKAMGFNTSTSSPTHFGVATRRDDFASIFHDLLTFSRANQVYWYSAYGGPSGFAVWGTRLGRGKLMPL